ncbi:hypothetical protein, partial [Streptomyces acidiscabies]|uniref:hypothetical protein n=1 Tax=Streptomyces acidiscabies TaxID=42234 RepID=UPI001C4A87A2
RGDTRRPHPPTSGTNGANSPPQQAAITTDESRLMQHFQATNARLMVSHPNGVCGTCASTIRAMLPTGAELTVRFQHGRRFFTGGVFVGD